MKGLQADKGHLVQKESQVKRALDGAIQANETERRTLELRVGKLQKENARLMKDKSVLCGMLEENLQHS